MNAKKHQKDNQPHAYIAPITLTITIPPSVVPVFKKYCELKNEMHEPWPKPVGPLSQERVVLLALFEEVEEAFPEEHALFTPFMEALRI